MYTFIFLRIYANPMLPSVFSVMLISFSNVPILQKKKYSYQVRDIKMAKAKELSRIPQFFFSKYIPKKFPTNKNKSLADLLSKPPIFFLSYKPKSSQIHLAIHSFY